MLIADGQDRHSLSGNWQNPLSDHCKVLASLIEAQDVVPVGVDEEEVPAIMHEASELNIGGQGRVGLPLQGCQV